MLKRLFTLYRKRILLGLLIIIVAIFAVRSKLSSVPVTTIEEEGQEVSLATVRELQNANTFSVVGTVRAVSEAALETEAGGRVTAVNVSIGDYVSAGTIIASIENSAERAQLLQAEGAYESALAGTKQSGASFEEAKIGVRNVYRETFSTADSAVNTTIDTFFSKIDGLKRYGLKITPVNAPASDYADSRMAIEPMLATWSERIASNFSGVGEEVMLKDAESAITAISNLTATLATAVADKENEQRFTESERDAHIAALAGTRAALDAALGSISRARSAYEQAQLSGDAGGASQSNAQLKSALGTLRSAEANYEKTIVRSPISGVVNALYLKAGEYTSNGKPAALVANNGSLEVSTALGEEDLDTIAVGDTVRINDSATGTITKVAPAIDPLSGKVEVKISIDDDLSLKNGSTVSVIFSRGSTETEDKTIAIPLSALKLLPSGPVVFGVNDANTLTVYQVTIGDILGETVEILSGLTGESVIVRDARGLKEGDVVSVARN